MLNWKKIQPFASPYILPFAALTCLTLVTQLLGLSLPFLVGHIAYAFGTEPKSELYRHVLEIVAIGAAIVILDQIHWNQYYKRVGAPIQKDIALAIFKKMSTLSLGQIDDDSGSIRETAQAGTTAVASSVDLIARRFVPALICLILTTVWIVSINWLMGILALVGFAAFSAATYRAVKGFISRIEEYSRKDNELKARFWERVANMSNVIIAGQQEAEMAKCAAEYRESISLGRKLWGSYQAALALAREPISLVSFATLLFVSIGMAFKGDITPASFVAIMCWSFGAFMSINGLTAPLRDLLENWGHISNLLEFLKMLPRAVSLPETVRPERFEGIAFRKVSFAHFSERHPGGKMALQNVTIDIRPEEYVAIVGSSGSGKTTLNNLMLGAFFPTTGNVFISKRNIKKIDLEWWWDRVGYVPQGEKLRLWNKTMRQNILYGKSGIPEERFVSALKAARLYDGFYENGLSDTKLLGENGCRLSGGERQRVAIARALVGLPSVLLFDEPTTGLDPENSAAIRETILELAKGNKSEFGGRKYTIVVIAHTMVMAAQADKVIVMDEGRVAGLGKHIDLIDSCPAYRKLCRMEESNPSLDESLQSESQVA